MNPLMAFTIVALLGASVASGGESQPAHWQAAEEIATHIAPADNAYAHKDCFIKWKGPDSDRFENRTDCSDFLNLLLEHVYRLTPAKLYRLTGHQRPTATAWFDAVGTDKAAGFLAPMTNVPDLRIGDLIFIKYPPGEPDTGHVMIVARTPIERQESLPLVPGTKQWAVQVIDSSKSGHGPTDTRHQTDNTFARGVGKGLFRLYTNADGSVAGYSWSVVKKSKFVPVSEHAVRFARITPPN